MWLYICKPSTKEAEAEDLELKANLGYKVRPIKSLRKQGMRYIYKKITRRAGDMAQLVSSC